MKAIFFASKKWLYGKCESSSINFLNATQVRISLRLISVYKTQKLLKQNVKTYLHEVVQSHSSVLDVLLLIEFKERLAGQRWKITIAQLQHLFQCVKIAISLHHEPSLLVFCKPDVQPEENDIILSSIYSLFFKCWYFYRKTRNNILCGLSLLRFVILCVEIDVLEFGSQWIKHSLLFLFAVFILLFQMGWIDAILYIQVIFLNGDELPILLLLTFSVKVIILVFVKFHVCKIKNYYLLEIKDYVSQVFNKVRISFNISFHFISSRRHLL
jgi:hypothetical protein